MPSPILPPPTDVWYDTFDELVAANNNWAQKQGYGIVKKRIKASNSRGIYKCYFECSRGKARASESQGYRNTAITKYGCPFTASTKRNDRGEWRLIV